jgi:hypothetical protein
LQRQSNTSGSGGVQMLGAEAEFERQLTNIACTRISHLYKTTPEDLWYSVSVKGVEIGILPKATDSQLVKGPTPQNSKR